MGQAPAAQTIAAVTRAVTFLVQYGPLTPEDRWEEDSGGSPYTIGIIVAALVAATKYLGAADQAYLFELVDDWNERIEEWSYVTASYLDDLYGIDGHYVRIGPVPGGSSVSIKNQANQSFAVPYQGVIGMEFMYLARLGLRQPQDPKLTSTLTLIDVFLRRNVGTGTAYYRYDFDGYGEQPDGSDYDGAHGVGRPWPLLAGERGHLAALRSEPWKDELTALLAMRSPSGLVPEQVWDLGPLAPSGSGASQPLNTGKPTLSATPLVWGHSELVKLALAGPTATPTELLKIVADYFATPRVPTVAHWRSSIPVVDLPARRDRRSSTHSPSPSTSVMTAGRPSPTAIRHPPSSDSIGRRSPVPRAAGGPRSISPGATRAPGRAPTTASRSSPPPSGEAPPAQRRLTALEPTPLQRSPPPAPMRNTCEWTARSRQEKLSSRRSWMSAISRSATPRDTPSRSA